MTEMPNDHVTVIGAGIVGSATALCLVRDGWKVTLVDAEPPGSQTSYGNAGAISPQSINPMAGPGVLKQIPKWLLDPLGPLALRWRYLPKAAPWLIKFVQSGTAEKIKAQSAALADLHRPVIDAHEELAALAGVKDLVKRQGALTVYETDANFVAGACATRATKSTNWGRTKSPRWSRAWRPSSSTRPGRRTAATPSTPAH